MKVVRHTTDEVVVLAGDNDFSRITKSLGILDKNLIIESSLSILFELLNGSDIFIIGSSLHA